MGWTFVYLMLILKIPIVALLTIVWWAIRSTPEESEPVTSDNDGGAKTREPRRHPRHPRKPLPRHPRRGPHGDPLPLPPPRTRTVIARARRIDRA
jgi:hypothetical protein